MLSPKVQKAARRRMEDIITDGRAEGTAAVDGAAFRRTEDDIC